VSNLEGQVLALQRSCEQLKAELAAATAEDGHKVAALRQQLEQQRAEMSEQVRICQTSFAWCGGVALSSTCHFITLHVMTA
jgi:hypothetical protein